MIAIFALFLATFALVWYFNRKNDRKGLKELPGPKGWPVIGNVLDLMKMPHLQFSKWTEEYGDIYQTRLGPIVNILVSNPKLVKEIFNDPNYVGRPKVEGLGIYEDDLFGIVNTEGELWEVHRRFLLRQLRDFGFGKSSMGSMIQEEVNEVIVRFKKMEGKPVKDMKLTCTLSVINSLWSVVSQERFQHDDPKLLNIVTNMNKAIEDLMKAGAVLGFYPWLRHVIPDLSGYTSFRKAMNENRKWFEETVEEHKRTYQEDNIRDFIDAYLTEMKKTTDPKSVFYGARAEKQLVAILSDVFFAGSDTTSSTLAWGVLYLCKYPLVQLKLQEEIETITNHSRSITVADRPNMPYTLAVMDEILRCSTIVPVGVQHRALEAKEFQGYYIPKGAWILSNLHYIHNNPKVWIDPERFRPERFIDSDGKYKKNDHLLPFVIGRRQCVGETLARDTIFLFITNIFQRFTISFDPNSPEPSLEPMPSVVLFPSPYSVVMKDRLQ